VFRHDLCRNIILGLLFIPVMSGKRINLAIVGNLGGTHVGESLRRATIKRDQSIIFFDASRASAGPRILTSLVWRFADHRPFLLQRFSKDVGQVCCERSPEVLIATGRAPITADTLKMLRANGVVCINYSSDDPFNPNHYAKWHLQALREFDLVFTTRRANVRDLQELGCKDVRWLPFGYDDELFGFTMPADTQLKYDVLFVGGADRDRVEFISEFLKSGISVGLVGGYWESYRATRSYALGHKSPPELCRLTATANVNLCLVRRANRDGHVMRSFEMAAIGACMIADDTDEHREIFGPDGDAVRYFRTPAEAAVLAKSLLADSRERARLRACAYDRVSTGGHTYRDRLASMLEAAAKHKKC
jgi:spore maturation protein CgeB